jgi:hypothetical protein
MRSESIQKASALIVTLVCVSMTAILTIVFLMYARLERGSARNALRLTEARMLSDLAADVALAKLKSATALGMTLGMMWSSEPGRIRIYQAANLGNSTDVDLFSALPGPDDPSTPDLNNVDLNRPSYEGRYPIATPLDTDSTAAMKIGWIPLRANLEEEPSKENPLIGRIAYWVDDESCKININVADGSKKDTVQSFGFGTPSEISLSALKDASGERLTAPLAAKISDYAWQNGFNTAAEITRASDSGEIPADFYEKNKFQITHYSKTPEISFNGDPRIYLFPVVRLNTGVVRSLLTNAYGVEIVTGFNNYLVGSTNSKKALISDPIDFVYPTSRQIEAALPAKTPFYQYGRHSDLDRAQFLSSSPGGTNYENYLFSTRIAEAIKGTNSLQGSFQWPAFSGNSVLSAKYNDRQIDSLALQILDFGSRTQMGDEARGGNLPSLVSKGMLSGKNAIGVGRTPKFTEFTVLFDAIRTSTNPSGTGPPPRVNNIPALQVAPQLEFYFPAMYGGLEWTGQYSSYWRLGQNQSGLLNAADQIMSGSSPMGGLWMDNLLSINGIDLSGCSYNGNAADPREPIYHPYRNGRGSSSNSQPAGNRRPPFRFSLGWAPEGPAWSPGEYRGVSSMDRGGVKLYGPNDPTLTAFSVRGGLVLWTEGGGSGQTRGNWDVAPLDSLRGDFRAASGDSNYIYSSEVPSAITAQLQEAVIPIPNGFSIPIPSVETAWHGYVSDPLVNKFPGDWVVASHEDDSTLQPGGTLANEYTDGANPGFNPSDGGDPLSLWMPRLDVAYPKQSRFPSVGALNYVRTGVAPDDLTVPLQQQKGTPWRSLSLTPTASPGQATQAGRYPDWAMLDLFTVPFLPQLPFRVGEEATPKRKLTSGGATEGKININNPAVPYPFSQAMSEAEQAQFPSRTAPLESLFLNLRVNTGYDALDVPVFSTLNDSSVGGQGGNVLDNLVQAIQSRVKNEGPFVLPGQMAELGEIDQFTYKGVAEGAQSRNDLLKQVLGATTTQSNVFSIWAVAQTVQKIPSNQNYGEFEGGDLVTSEVRRRYVVERYIDLGADGVPGNAINPGTDGVVGTEDDPVDPIYHPAMQPPFPYLWRIVSMEDIPR